MIYFDNSATTKVLPEAAERAVQYMIQDFYNPSAAYSKAYSVEKDLNSARTTIASSRKVNPDEIFFTSGATESNNIAVFGTLSSKKKVREIVTTQVEHPSVYETIKVAAAKTGAVIKYVPLMEDGTVNLKILSETLSDNTDLISIMHVNNELGSVNDLKSIREIINQYAPDAVFHSDGVQGYMKCPLNTMPCDLYSVSGHKIHAPKGVGFIYAKKGIKNSGGQIGGGQEKNFRSGTINTPAILAMEIAVKAYIDNFQPWHDAMYRVKCRMAANLSQIKDVVLNGPSVEAGAPHILNESFLGVRGEVLLHALEQEGILVSTGSACSSKKTEKNRILHAVGIDGTRQEGAIRFSFSPFNTIEEVDYACEKIENTVTFLRKYKRR